MLFDVTYSGFEEGRQHLQFSVIRDRLSAVLFGSHLELFSSLEVQLLFSLNGDGLNAPAHIGADSILLLTPGSILLEPGQATIQC